MTSSSLLVPNSFSSWLLGALSYAPCAPWLFAGGKRRWLALAPMMLRWGFRGLKGSPTYLCVTKILNAETK